MINSANEVVEPGVIRNSPGTLNRFTLGEPDGAVSHRVQSISAAFERAGVPAPISTAIRADIWDKLLRNMSTAPICALTGEPIGVIGRHDELLALAKALMEEGLATARAHGITADVDVERAYGRRPSSPHKSSMLQDLERGRPPEIDGILTAVQQFARAAGVATPHLDAVTALVIEKARKAGLYPKANWEGGGGT
jgi:2-dehydropantoate 2-reductase